MKSDQKFLMINYLRGVSAVAHMQR